MLTVASNHMPYRLPLTLQEVMLAERGAAEHAAVMAANPPPAPTAAAANDEQDTGEAGDTQLRTTSKTGSAGSKSSKRGDFVQQTSRCTSARSGVSDNSFLERNQDGSGSMQGS